MKIFLLLLTTIYLLPEIISLNLLIKSKGDIQLHQQKRIDEIKRQINNSYSKNIDTVSNVTLLLFIFYYIFYIGFANIVFHTTWFLALSGFLTIIFITDFIRAKNMILDIDKMQKHISNNKYIIYERTKIIFTFGYGLLVLILLIIG